MTDWLVIGVSGVTCGGKTTLANQIHSKLENSVMLNQDDYFFPADSPRHTMIPELNHINWDILTSVDMARMHSDVLKIISEENCESSGNKKVLILEGFLIFNYKPISDLCDLKYYLTLTKEHCQYRREKRIYDPPDVPSYFDIAVWPEYVRYRSEIFENVDNYSQIKSIDGSRPMEDVFEEVFDEISTRFPSFVLAI